MALVKVEKNALASTWSTRNKKATSYQVPDGVERPVVDYGRLKELLSIEGLSDSTNPSSTDEAHRQFIDEYKSIFVEPDKLKGLPFHSQERSKKRESHTVLNGPTSVGGPTSTEDEVEEKPLHPVDRISHDVRDHTTKLRVKSRQEKKQMEMTGRVKSLRQLMKKLPYERTAAETEEISQHLSHFPQLADQVSSTMLRELCVMAYLETWIDPNVPVFGNTGWHILLKGSMRPQQIPWKKLLNEEVYFPNPSPEPFSDLDALGVGESFGTLEKVADRDGCSRILSVVTLEPNCEFLKISTSDYDRVSKHLGKRDETEKINLLQSCATFSMWAQQPIARSDSVNKGHPLVKVASVLEWETFPANTILVSEGYKAPFIGIIKSGNCQVLRHVEVVNNLKKGKTEKKQKQVVMGKLGPNESFGEVSLTEQTPMSCSIITATKVELGCIGQDKLSELDETTKRLLHQSSAPTFGVLSKDDIHREYVGQELKREWNEFKHKVVLDVINAKGVRPGHGKWAK